MTRVFASAAVVVFLTFPSSALAQDRGFAAGLAGVTFQSQSGLFVGGEAGVNLGGTVAVYGGVSWIQDVTPNDIHDAVEELDMNVEFSVPALLVMGGVRASTQAGPVRAYAVGGVGLAHLSAHIEIDGRDVTSELEDEVGEDLTTDEFAFELGGGIMIPVGTNGFVDLGYRYLRITGEDEGIDVSRVYGGFGIRF